MSNGNDYGIMMIWWLLKLKRSLTLEQLIDTFWQGIQAVAQNVWTSYPGLILGSPCPFIIRGARSSGAALSSDR